MGSKSCHYCAGTGFVDEWIEELHDWEEVMCDDCGGTGIDDDEEELP
ncbi:hypothetical protein [Mixta calida]|nr:hypothetical protein [Mixta calida]MDU4288358.1 hypothetical protein [Mixta calida]